MKKKLQIKRLNVNIQKKYLCNEKMLSIDAKWQNSYRSITKYRESLTTAVFQQTNDY